MTALPILQFIAALAALIVVHELGHFFAAKLSGIKIQEFGIGFPPRLVRLFRAGETDFTLNWIPLGGFVRPAGENDPKVPGGLAASSPWTRIFVLASGPAMNILAALLIFVFIFMQLGKPDLTTVQIMDVSAGSPAAGAGLRTGDIVLKVNDVEVNSTEQLRNEIYAHLGETIAITYQRDGAVNTASLIPRDPPPADGAIGIAMGNPRVPITFGESVVFSVQAIGEQVNALVTLPGRLLSGEVSPDQGRLVGYKGMYDLYSEVREADASLESQVPPGINTLAFFASISISLGLLNLLPVPALDGGRILFTLPEILFRRRIPATYENVVNLVGLALLFILIFYVNIQDFLNPVVFP
ncbi:MAG: M50 family metallopeptidase [Anaerolineales bacterium]